MNDDYGFKKMTFLKNHDKINTTHYLTYLGWFNSIAGVVKRRFASYVKLHLNTNDKEKESRNIEKERRGSANNERLSTNPFLNSSNGSASTSVAGNYGTTGIACPSSPRVLSGMDRRHRSPDPPPR